MMKKTLNKRIFAVLAAVLLGAALCAPAALADETGGNDYDSQTDYTDYTDIADTDENADSADNTVDAASSEDTSETETFFNELKADNGIGRTLFIAGAICVVLGVGGIVSLILWQRAGKKRDRNEADRAEVLDEIEQEERRNRRRREEERLHRERMQERRETEARVQSERFDPNRDTGELPPIQAAKYTAERPIVPETPVSMQPQNVRRPAPQAPIRRTVPAEKLQKSNASAAQRPAATSAPDVQQRVVPQQRPAARPAQTKPAAQPKAPEKYDLEDILREVREMNAKK